MRRYVKAGLAITLIDEVWENVIDDFLEDFGDTYGVRDEDGADYSDRFCAFTCTSDFDDDEAAGSTLAYCLSEDMLDNDYPLEDIEVLWEEIEEE